MRKLTAELKKALSALVYANAGEMLSDRDKDHMLAGDKKPATQTRAQASPPLRVVAAQPATPALNGQVGLYLGANLDPAVVEYAAHTCKQLNAALTVVTFQAEDDARALLTPHLGDLGREGVVWRIVRLQGEPQATLPRYLRHEARMLFLVCSESGFLGHTVRSGGARRMDFGLPIVLVTADQAKPKSARQATARS